MNDDAQMVDHDIPIERLLEFHDESFVVFAYKSILGRLPDPGGMANYVTQIRSGVHRVQIILELADSREGKAICRQRQKIDTTYRSGFRNSQKLRTRFLRLLNGEAAATADRRARISENRIYMIEQTLTRRKMRICHEGDPLLPPTIIETNASGSQLTDYGEYDEQLHSRSISENVLDTFYEIKGAIARSRRRISNVEDSN